MVRQVMRAASAAVLLCLVVWLAGCGRSGQKKTEPKAEAKGVPVEVAAATQGTMEETVTVTGTIKAARQSSISAQISGRVLEVSVREGDLVTVGQVLVRLDPSEPASQARQAEAGAEAAQARLEATQRRLDIVQQGARQEERAIARNQLAQAESALRTAEADLKRLKGLYEQGAISKQQLDGAQTAYDTAKAQRDSARRSLELIEKGARPEEVEAAKKDVEAAAAGLRQANAMLAEARERLSYTVIRAPIRGVVFERGVEPGEIVGQGGAPLLRIADPSSVYYEATVPERVALRVETGQRVEVMVQGDGERPVQGEVERMVPVANPASRDFLVRIRITGGEGLTKPGMFARGSVVVRENRGTVIVPKDALVEREGKLFAFVVVGGKAEQREVQTGIVDSERAEIVSGVRPGESVVVVGAQGLKSGDPVQVRNEGG
ncbi:MAG: efflux RND transporter periplasmic adaptor subunit [Armatimonadota bacterium]